MNSKIFSKIFAAIPEFAIKQYIRAFLHRIKYKDYRTYYRNRIWELHYPSFVLRYGSVPSPAADNYLLLECFVDRDFDIIIDGGGFMGTFGLLMARKCPRARVYIFEMDPVNYNKIVDNLRLNDLRNVIVEPIGLWKEQKVLRIMSNADLTSTIYEGEDLKDVVDAEFTSIDDYFNGVCSKQVFIKMNIEGAEVDALNGAFNFIRRNKIDFAIATDHLVDGQMSFMAVEEIFDRWGVSRQTITHGAHITTHASKQEAHR